MWMLMPLSMLLPPRADTAYRLLATIGSYFKKLCTVITRNQSECNAKCFCHKGSIPTRRTYGQTDEHNCIKRQTRPNNLSRFYALYWWKLLSYTKDPNKQTKKRKAEMFKVHSKHKRFIFHILTSPLSAIFESGKMSAGYVYVLASLANMKWVGISFGPFV